MRKTFKKGKAVPHAGFLKKRQAQLLGRIKRIIQGQQLVKELETAMLIGRTTEVQNAVNRIHKSGIDFKNERQLSADGYYDYCMGFAEDFLKTPDMCEVTYG